MQTTVCILITVNIYSYSIQLSNHHTTEGSRISSLYIIIFGTPSSDDDKTLARLLDFTYWIGIAKDASHYCTNCITCQMVKVPARPPASLQPIVTSRPWELVAVDILKVPMSSRGNQYLLVAQDYFSKWPFAIALPDQKTATIVTALRDQVFTMVGPPRRLHSDQGRNFESHILSELCKAFGVEKSRTTPYHPMGDRLVDRMNRSLLNLLRTLMER